MTLYNSVRLHTTIDSLQNGRTHLSSRFRGEPKINVTNKPHDKRRSWMFRFLSLSFDSSTIPSRVALRVAVAAVPMYSQFLCEVAAAVTAKRVLFTSLLPLQRSLQDTTRRGHPCDPCTNPVRLHLRAFRIRHPSWTSTRRFPHLRSRTAP